MANSVGCTRSIPVTVSGAVIASVTENPDSRAISGSTSATVAANTGSLGEQVGAHRRPLRTLPGEHPHRSAVVLADRRPDTECRRRRPRADPRPAPRGCRRSPRCAPAGAPAGAPACRPDPIPQASRRVSSTQSASRPAVCRSPSAEVADSGNSSGPSIAGAGWRAARCDRLGRLLHDGVHVGSRHPVRRHRRAPRPW